MKQYLYVEEDVIISNYICVATQNRKYYINILLWMSKLKGLVQEMKKFCSYSFTNIILS